MRLQCSVVSAMQLQLCTRGSGVVGPMPQQLGIMHERVDFCSAHLQSNAELLKLVYFNPPHSLLQYPQCGLHVASNLAQC